MLPVDEVPLLEGEHVEEGAEVAAVVDLVADKGASLLALGLRDAVRDHARRRRVRETLKKGRFRQGLVSYIWKVSKLQLHVSYSYTQTCIFTDRKYWCREQQRN